MTQLNLAKGGTPFTGPIIVPGGSAANPGLQFDTSASGIYNNGTTSVAVALNGAAVATFTATGQTIDTLVANAVVGGDSSLDLTGQAAAQGGVVAIVGGASATASNAGGAVSMTGGIGTTTAVGGAASIVGGAGVGAANGGAVSVTGGASGAGATGAGGAVAVAGGAAASTNDAGGALTITGGAGAGTGNGGAVTIISGAAGSTGVAGAIAVAVGAATAGNGSSITVTGGNGAGGTASGGNINLVGGTAVSTGNPGEVQINGNSSLSFATYYFTGTPAATNQVFFVAPRAMRVKTMSEVHSTAAGGVSTMDITKETTTGAPGSGTSLFQSGSFNLNATANTVQNATVSTTVATVNLAAGDRLSVKFNNTIQSSAGVVVTVGMVPI